MRGKPTISINGRLYDAVSGLAITTSNDTNVIVTDHTESVPITVKRVAAQPHRVTPKHSVTLRRDLVKKPSGPHDHLAKQHHDHAHVAKSPAISKFAPHPSMPAQHTATKSHESAFVSSVHRAHATAHKPQSAPSMSSRELKDHLIATKLASATPNTTRPAKKIRLRAPTRVSSILAACFAIMLLGGYVAYINMPQLSVRVAAAQAGVDAGYPGYTPSGYRFDGPVAYSSGKVTLAFAANGGTTAYKIIQQKSNWDSQAVLDNYVATKSKNYDVNTSQGLTIYTYQNNAAWVNHGVLYTIDGDAPLKTEQVLHIAQSL